jgi:hypothetical protein
MCCARPQIEELVEDPWSYTRHLRLVCIWALLVACAPDAPTRAADVRAAPTVAPPAFAQPPMPMRSDPCANVGCSKHGTCKSGTRFPHLGGEVAARCECDAGYYPYGLECVACRAVGARYDIDLSIARFRGRVTWKGQAIPKDLAGELLLVSEGDVGSRGEVVLGRGAYDVEVIAGRYDLVFREVVYPADATWIVIARSVDVSGDTRHDVTLPFERTEVRVTLAGARPPKLRNGSLVLRRGDDRIDLPIVATDVPLHLPPGTYEVAYTPPPGQLVVGGAPPPPKAPLHVPEIETPIQPGLVVGPGRLAIDLPLVAASGSVRNLGAPFDPTTSEIGFIAAGEVEEYGVPSGAAIVNGRFSTLLFRGTYDVWLSTKIGDRRIGIQLARAIDITQTPLDLDARSAAIKLAGRFTIGTRAPPGGILVAIGERHVWGVREIPLQPDGSFATALPRGTYTIAYLDRPKDTLGGVLPLERITIDRDRRWTFDLPLVAVAAEVTIDGVAATPPSDGDLALVSTASPIGYPIWPIPEPVPPGTYRARFNFGSPGPLGFPDVSDIPRTPIRITTATRIPIALATRKLVGSLTMNGAPRRSEGAISLAGLDDGDHLADFTTGSYASVVVPGTYAVSYFHAFAAANKLSPRNTRVPLGCIIVK